MQTNSFFGLDDRHGDLVNDRQEIIRSVVEFTTQFGAETLVDVSSRGGRAPIGQFRTVRNNKPFTGIVATDPLYNPNLPGAVPVHITQDIALSGETLTDTCSCDVPGASAYCACGQGTRVIFYLNTFQHLSISDVIRVADANFIYTDPNKVAILIAGDITPQRGTGYVHHKGQGVQYNDGCYQYGIAAGDVKWYADKPNPLLLEGQLVFGNYSLFLTPIAKAGESTILWRLMSPKTTLPELRPVIRSTKVKPLVVVRGHLLDPSGCPRPAVGYMCESLWSQAVSGLMLTVADWSYFSTRVSQTLDRKESAGLFYPRDNLFWVEAIVLAKYKALAYLQAEVLLTKLKTQVSEVAISGILAAIKHRVLGRFDTWNSDDTDKLISACSSFGKIALYLTLLALGVTVPGLQFLLIPVAWKVLSYCFSHATKKLEDLASSVIDDALYSSIVEQPNLDGLKRVISSFGFFEFEGIPPTFGGKLALVLALHAHDAFSDKEPKVLDLRGLISYGSQFCITCRTRHGTCSTCGQTDCPNHVCFTGQKTAMYRLLQSVQFTDPQPTGCYIGTDTLIAAGVTNGTSGLGEYVHTTAAQWFIPDYFHSKKSTFNVGDARVDLATDTKGLIPQPTVAHVLRSTCPQSMNYGKGRCRTHCFNPSDGSYDFRATCDVCVRSYNSDCPLVDQTTLLSAIEESRLQVEVKCQVDHVDSGHHFRAKMLLRDSQGRRILCGCGVRSYHLLNPVGKAVLGPATKVIQRPVYGGWVHVRDAVPGDIVVVMQERFLVTNLARCACSLLTAGPATRYNVLGVCTAYDVACTRHLLRGLGGPCCFGSLGCRHFWSTLNFEIVRWSSPGNIFFMCDTTRDYVQIVRGITSSKMGDGLSADLLDWTEPTEDGSTSLTNEETTLATMADDTPVEESIDIVAEESEELPPSIEEDHNDERLPELDISGSVEPQKCAPQEERYAFLTNVFDRTSFYKPDFEALRSVFEAFAKRNIRACKPDPSAEFWSDQRYHGWDSESSNALMACAAHLWCLSQPKLLRYMLGAGCDKPYTPAELEVVFCESVPANYEAYLARKQFSVLAALDCSSLEAYYGIELTNKSELRMTFDLDTLVEIPVFSSTCLPKKIPFKPLKTNQVGSLTKKTECTKTSGVLIPNLDLLPGWVVGNDLRVTVPYLALLNVNRYNMNQLHGYWLRLMQVVLTILKIDKVSGVYVAKDAVYALMRVSDLPAGYKYISMGFALEADRPEAQRDGVTSPPARCSVSACEPSRIDFDQPEHDDSEHDGDASDEADEWPDEDIEQAPSLSSFEMPNRPLPSQPQIRDVEHELSEWSGMRYLKLDFLMNEVRPLPRFAADNCFWNSECYCSHCNPRGLFVANKESFKLVSFEYDLDYIVTPLKVEMDCLHLALLSYGIDFSGDAVQVLYTPYFQRRHPSNILVVDEEAGSNIRFTNSAARHDLHFVVTKGSPFHIEPIQLKGSGLLALKAIDSGKTPEPIDRGPKRKDDDEADGDLGFDEDSSNGSRSASSSEESHDGHQEDSDGPPKSGVQTLTLGVAQNEVIGLTAQEDGPIRSQVQTLVSASAQAKTESGPPQPIGKLDHGPAICLQVPLNQDEGKFHVTAETLPVLVRSRDPRLKTYVTVDKMCGAGFVKNSVLAVVPGRVVLLEKDIKFYTTATKNNTTRAFNRARAYRVLDNGEVEEGVWLYDVPETKEGLGRIWIGDVSDVDKFNPCTGRNVYTSTECEWQSEKPDLACLDPYCTNFNRTIPRARQSKPEAKMNLMNKAPCSITLQVNPASLKEPNKDAKTIVEGQRLIQKVLGAKREVNIKCHFILGPWGSNKTSSISGGKLVVYTNDLQQAFAGSQTPHRAITDLKAGDRVVVDEFLMVNSETLAAIYLIVGNPLILVGDFSQHELNPAYGTPFPLTRDNVKDIQPAVLKYVIMRNNTPLLAHLTWEVYLSPERWWSRMGLREISFGVAPGEDRFYELSDEDPDTSFAVRARELIAKGIEVRVTTPKVYNGSAKGDYSDSTDKQAILRACEEAIVISSYASQGTQSNSAVAYFHYIPVFNKKELTDPKHFVPLTRFHKDNKGGIVIGKGYTNAVSWYESCKKNGLAITPVGSSTISAFSERKEVLYAIQRPVSVKGQRSDSDHKFENLVKAFKFEEKVFLDPTFHRGQLARHLELVGMVCEHQSNSYQRENNLLTSNTRENWCAQFDVYRPNERPVLIVLDWVVKSRSIKDESHVSPEDWFYAVDNLLNRGFRVLVKWLFYQENWGKGTEYSPVVNNVTAVRSFYYPALEKAKHWYHHADKEVYLYYTNPSQLHARKCKSYNDLPFQFLRTYPAVEFDSEIFSLVVTNKAKSDLGEAEGDYEFAESGFRQVSKGISYHPMTNLTMHSHIGHACDLSWQDRFIYKTPFYSAALHLVLEVPTETPGVFGGSCYYFVERQLVKKKVQVTLTYAELTLRDERKHYLQLSPIHGPGICHVQYKNFETAECLEVAKEIPNLRVDETKIKEPKPGVWLGAYNPGIPIIGLTGIMFQLSSQNLIMALRYRNIPTYHAPGRMRMLGLSYVFHYIESHPELYPPKSSLSLPPLHKCVTDLKASRAKAILNAPWRPITGHECWGAFCKCNEVHISGEAAVGRTVWNPPKQLLKRGLPVGKAYTAWKKQERIEHLHYTGCMRADEIGELIASYNPTMIYDADVEACDSSADPYLSYKMTKMIYGFCNEAESEYFQLYGDWGALTMDSWRRLRAPGLSGLFIGQNPSGTVLTAAHNSEKQKLVKLIAQNLQRCAFPMIYTSDDFQVFDPTEEDLEAYLYVAMMMNWKIKAKLLPTHLATYNSQLILPTNDGGSKYVLAPKIIRGLKRFYIKTDSPDWEVQLQRLLKVEELGAAMTPILRSVRKYLMNKWGVAHVVPERWKNKMRLQYKPYAAQVRTMDEQGLDFFMATKYSLAPDTWRYAEAMLEAGIVDDRTQAILQAILEVDDEPSSKHGKPTNQGYRHGDIRWLLATGEACMQKRVFQRGAPYPA